MQNFPTWTLLLLIVPLAALAFARRHDRPVRPLEWAMVAATAVTLGLAAAWFPEATARMVTIAAIITAAFAGALLALAGLEAAAGRLRRPRRRVAPAGPAPARGPAAVSARGHRAAAT